ncbi:MAG: hypothetical protein ACLFNQ_09900 [Spirochaetaceae bacterium]
MTGRKPPAVELENPSPPPVTRLTTALSGCTPEVGCNRTPYHGGCDEWIDNLSNRYKRAEVTQYVTKANTALLRSEIMGLSYVLNGCADFPIDSEESVDELADHIREHLHGRLQHRQYPEALYTLLAKKVDKVAEYLKLEVPPRAEMGQEDAQPGSVETVLGDDSDDEADTMQRAASFE